VCTLNDPPIEGHSRSSFNAVNGQLQQLAEDWMRHGTAVGQGVRQQAITNDGGMLIFVSTERSLRPVEGSALAEAVDMQSQWER
jgi:hypothetical protein